MMRPLHAPPLELILFGLALMLFWYRHTGF